MMQMSIHYYVLSLSEEISKLYEGFRDKLIDINDGQFPLSISAIENHASIDTRLKKFYHQTDQRFEKYYKQDPLRLVVVGEKHNIAIFDEVMNHQDILIGTVQGKYTGTSPHDLGKIVWPVVKDSLAGINKNALGKLAIAVRLKKIISGIDAVGRSVETETGSTLYVEEDYHVKGSLHKFNQSIIISKHVDISEVIDDVVDLIIEKVLRTDGTVIFLNSGTLANLGKIALIRS